MKYNKELGRVLNKKDYAKEWSKNSADYAKSGFYKKIFSNFEHSGESLEIGCGTGHSTLEISNRSEKVICIEINKKLAEKAINKLQQNGIKASIVKKRNGKFQETDAKVDIFLVDFFDDDLLVYLKNKSFNSIFCIFIGAEPETISSSLKIDVVSLRKEDMSQYRHLLHSKLYELSSIILKNDGGIYIADRAYTARGSSLKDVEYSAIDLHKQLSKGFFKQQTAITLNVDDEFKTSNLNYVREDGFIDQKIISLIISKK